MKSKLLTIVACLTAFAFTTAQQPGATPTPAPVAPQAAMTLPQSSTAALVASNIITQVAGTLNGAIKIIDNGFPAQPESPQGPAIPAVSAKDIQAALGTENVMKLRSAVAILSAAATPAPTATPKK